MNRALGVAVTLALLAALWIAAREVGRQGPLHDPRPGAAVTLSLFEVSALGPPNRYTVRRGGRSIEVEGTTEGLQVGDELTLHGQMRDGIVIESHRVLATGRPAKKALGGLGLAIACGAWILTVTGVPGRWALRG